MLLQLTVHQNLASLPLVMIAPSVEVPRSSRALLKAPMIFWAYLLFNRFSGALRMVMTKMLPSYRSNARSDSSMTFSCGCDMIANSRNQFYYFTLVWRMVGCRYVEEMGDLSLSRTRRGNFTPDSDVVEAKAKKFWPTFIFDFLSIQAYAPP